MNKSIKKNYILNLIYEVFALLVPIFVMPYISRILGAGGVGVYSYTYSIIFYFMLLGALGFTTYSRREMAKKRDDFENQKRIFWEVTILKFITSIISAIVYEIVIVIFFYHTYYYIYLQTIVIYLIGTAFDIIYFYQANEDFDKIVFKNIFIKILGVILIFVFVKNSNDLYIYILLQAIIFIVSNILLWFTLPKKIFKFSIKELKFSKHMMPALKLFIPTIASSIYTVLDKTLIGMLVSETIVQNEKIINVSDFEIGVYEQSEKIIKMMITVLTSLSVIISPRNSYYYEKKEFNKIKDLTQKTYSYIMLLSLPMLFGVISIANMFCPLFFGDGYDKAGNLMCILSILIPVISLSGVFGMQYLTAIGEDNKYIISVTIGAAINLVLNIFFIPYFYSYGAAIATVIAEICIFLMLFIFSRKIVDKKIFITTFFKYFLGAFIMYLISINISFNNNIYTIVIRILISVLVYGIYLLLIKDELLQSVLNIVKRKLRKRD